MLPASFGFDTLDPALQDRLLAGMARVEARLRDSVTQADAFTDTASKHLMIAGGKRIRPLFTLLCAQLGPRPDAPEVFEAAVVVELTHLATLYHDDVMDSAPLRRGAPTAHQVWGNNVAILTGDLLFARASILISALGGEALGIQAHTFERLCLGQLHETVGPQEGEDPVGHYLQVLADKTGSLISAAAHFGALFSGLPEETLRMLVTYGEKVGTAFQLADDIIDVTGKARTSGKRPGTDLREHVPTLPVLLLRRHQKEGTLDPAGRELLELIDSDLSRDDALERVVSALAAHPVAEEAWAVARAHAQEAADLLAPLPDGPVKASLASFAAATVNRDV